MDTLTKKTITTKRGMNYTYWTSAAAAGKPTVLLQHGFPDEAAEWAGVITKYLVPHGYGVIAPDLLGYGETSKPTETAAYKYGLMAADLVEILDAEQVSRCVSLGHDHGSRIAQMLWNLHPDRVSGLVTVAVALQPFSNDKPFNLDAALEQAQQTLGYGNLWYWKLFTAEDGPKILLDNVDLTFEAAHSPSTWRETLCAKDGMRDVLVNRNESIFRRAPYATDEMKDRFVKRFRRDGVDAPLNWYRALVFNHQDDQANPANGVVDVPYLFVGYKDDVVCRHEAIELAIKAGIAPKITRKILDGPHWGFLERPDEFGNTLIEWLQKNITS